MAQQKSAWVRGQETYEEPGEPDTWDLAHVLLTPQNDSLKKLNSCGHPVAEGNQPDHWSWADLVLSWLLSFQA